MVSGCVPNSWAFLQHAVVGRRTSRVSTTRVYLDDGAWRRRVLLLAASPGVSFGWEGWADSHRGTIRARGL